MGKRLPKALIDENGMVWTRDTVSGWYKRFNCSKYITNHGFLSAKKIFAGEIPKETHPEYEVLQRDVNGDILKVFRFADNAKFQVFERGILIVVEFEPGFYTIQAISEKDDRSLCLRLKKVKRTGDMFKEKTFITADFKKCSILNTK